MDEHVPFFFPVICGDFDGSKDPDKISSNCTPVEKQSMDEPIIRFCIWLNQRIFYYDGICLVHGHFAVAEMVRYHYSQFKIRSKKQSD